MRVLRILHAAIAGRGEIGVALVLLPGESLRCHVDIHRRLGRSDHGLLNVKLRALAPDGGLRRGDIGLGLIKRDLEVAVVDSRQHLAGLHVLVIADENLIEVAGDFRGNRGVVGLHIGVIGRDQKATHRPIIPAVPGRGGEQRGGGSCQQGPT